MFDTTICNKFPLDETLLLWVTQISETGKTYYIVSDQFRNEYQLWREKKPTRYKSDDPSTLYKYIK